MSTIDKASRANFRRREPSLHHVSRRLYVALTFGIIQLEKRDCAVLGKSEARTRLTFAITPARKIANSRETHVKWCDTSDGR